MINFMISIILWYHEIDLKATSNPLQRHKWSCSGAKQLLSLWTHVWILVKCQDVLKTPDDWFHEYWRCLIPMNMYWNLEEGIYDQIADVIKNVTSRKPSCNTDYKCRKWNFDCPVCHLKRSLNWGETVETAFPHFFSQNSSVSYLKKSLR